MTDLLSRDNNTNEPGRRQELPRAKLSGFAIASVLTTYVGYVSFFYYDELRQFLPAVIYCIIYFPIASIGFGIAAIIQNRISHRRLWWLAILTIPAGLLWGLCSLAKI